MEPLNKKIQTLFVKNGWRLSLAESCTGGSLAAQLVSLPDASQYFQGSIVAYSNAAKRELLNVKQETLETFGAVSVETAAEMAYGAMAAFHADYAIAVTGIAGPTGGSLLKPVGTVSFAIASCSKTITWTACFEGERECIMALAVEEALSLLWKSVIFDK